MTSTQKTQTNICCWAIRVRGTVQGVGFRPTVFKLAHQIGITGSVLNDGDGVLIEAFGEQNSLADFVLAIENNSPPLARIEEISHITVTPLPDAIPALFTISKSHNSEAKTNVSADAATCAACIEDIFSPFSRRFRYPFTNCTHCGPRLSIVKSIPYDRAMTSMAKFPMCSDCQKEYEDPEDRRFHAQPNACHVCGPRAWLERCDGKALCIESMTHLDDVDATATLIQRGEIVAIKGIGGFHLACDASNEKAVAELRQRKLRFHKPFALMGRDLSIIKKYCQVSAEEEALLNNHCAAIVLLEQTDKKLAPAVAPGQKTLGFMLPYTPLHHLLMKRLTKPIILTSGNLSDEPQCTDNDEARKRLGKIADYLLLHDRDIVNRLDDSVVRTKADGTSEILRRARGYAPSPIKLPTGFESAPEILSMGGELKNTFCLLQNNRAIISQHMGDLEEANTYKDYKKNLDLYQNCFQFKPARIAIDFHPEYLASKLGHKLAEEQSLPLDQIQHHHAHIASCLADNGWPQNAGPVIGVALDGLGYGLDDTFWGGEFLLADYGSCERLATFKPVAMLGGAQAMREPWRNTYAHLMAEMGWPRYKMDYDDIELTRFLEEKPLATFNSMLKTRTNSPLASSCGRLFDAVAAAMGICRDQASYEGQAAIEMEALVDQKVLAEESELLAYPFAIPRLKTGANNGLSYIEPLAMWQALLGDLTLDTAPGVMAARFHKGLAKAIVTMIDKLCYQEETRWLATVALSGGVFQNKLLLKLVRERLLTKGYDVLCHQQVPTNDGGISLGQAVISAAKQIEQKERSHVSWHTWASR